MPFVQSPQQSQFDQNRNFLLGTGPEPTGPGPDPSAPISLSGAPGEIAQTTGITSQTAPISTTTQEQAPGSENYQTASPSAPAQESQSMGSLDFAQKAPQQTYDPTAGGAYQGLLNPFQPQIQGQSGGLQQVYDQFMGAAGPSRTYEGIGAEETLQAAINPALGTEGLTDRTQAAKDLAFAQYEGPTELNQENLADLYDQYLQTQQRADALRTAGGIAGTLQASVGGLTPGMARFDAQNLIDQGFQRDIVNQVYPELSALGSRFETQPEAARDYAEQRAGEEKAIAEASRGFLTGEREETLGAVDAAVQQRRADEQALLDLYNQYMGSGDLSILGQVAPESFRTDFAPEDAQGITPQNVFDTPGKAQLAEAQKVAQEIVAKYPPDIQALIPHLGLTITSMGNEGYTLGPEIAGSNTGQDLWHLRNRGVITHQQAVQLMAFVKEFAAAGFSPGTTRTQEGAYSTVAPMFDFGLGVYDPSDERSFVDFQEGVRATRENTATDDQKFVVNQVGEILEEALRVGDAGEPYRAAMIFAEGQRYLDEEIARLEERRETLDAEGKAYLGAVKRQKRRYEKARDRAMWGDIARVMVGIGSAGSTEIFRPITEKVQDSAFSSMGGIAEGLL